MPAKPIVGVAAVVLVAAAVVGCDASDEPDLPVSGAAAEARTAPIDPPPADPDVPFEEWTVAQIQEAVVADLEDVTSVRAKGSGEIGGKMLDIDVRVDANGHCNQWLSGRHGTSRIVTDGRTPYVKGDAEYWSERYAEYPDAARHIVDVAGDKWLQYPAGSTLDTSLCTLGNVIGNYFPEGIGVGARKGRVDVIRGHRVIEILLASQGGTDRLWIATEGDHHVLRLSSSGGDRMSFDLLGYNEPVGRVRPPRNRTVNMLRILR